MTPNDFWIRNIYLAIPYFLWLYIISFVFLSYISRKNLGVKPYLIASDVETDSVNNKVAALQYYDKQWELTHYRSFAW